MFTRAYDTILIAKNIPYVYGGEDSLFSTTEISDDKLNVKSISGTIRTHVGHTYQKSATNSSSASYQDYGSMFSVFNNKEVPNSIGQSSIVVGTNNIEPNYEDYKIQSAQLTYLDVPMEFEAVYDNENGEFVSTVSQKFSNNTGNDCVIYEVGIYTKQAYSQYKGSGVSSSYVDTFLIYRDVLETPITVPAGGICNVSFTRRVGRGNQPNTATVAVEV